jgi:Raf kinase inhibitor-like YbhB/YbcL family protein
LPVSTKAIIIAIAAFAVGGIGVTALLHKPVPHNVAPSIPQHIAAVEEKPVPSKYVRDMLDDMADEEIPVPQKNIVTLPNHPLTLQTGNLPEKMLLSSSAIQPNEKISLYYTCYQKNVSPPLEWKNAPEGAKSFVILLEFTDLDKAMPWLWAVYNIPEKTGSLPEALPKTPVTKDNLEQMAADNGNAGYLGPCQPKGEHRYNFKIFALDTVLELKGGASEADLIRAMNDHILDMGKLPFLHYYRL